MNDYYRNSRKEDTSKLRAVNIGRAKANESKRKYHSGWRHIALVTRSMKEMQKGEQFEKYQTVSSGLMFFGVDLAKGDDVSCKIYRQVIGVDELMEEKAMNVKILEPVEASRDIRRKVSLFGRFRAWLRAVMGWIR